MMKIIFSYLLLLCCGTLCAQDVYVKGYTKSNGTYVEPHYRTAPNSTVNDNFSTVGNVNPYTGEPGTVPRENDYNYNYTTPDSDDYTEDIMRGYNYGNSPPIDKRLINPIYEPDEDRYSNSYSDDEDEYIYNSPNTDYSSDVSSNSTDEYWNTFRSKAPQETPLPQSNYQNNEIVHNAGNDVAKKEDRSGALLFIIGLAVLLLFFRIMK